MALSPKTATVFLVDASASMNESREFIVNGQRSYRTGLDVAKQYIKAKIVARIMRDLKTTPFGIISYGHEKTKNVLTMRAKQKAMDEDRKYSRKDDPYQHCYELLPLTWTFDKTLLDRVDQMQAGYEGVAPGDSFSAIILGIETIAAHSQLSKYTFKEVCIITDAEHEVDWDGIRSTAKRMNALGVSLTVIGMDFNDEDLGYVEENKSKTKAVNEEYIRSLVEALEQDSIVANARRAIAAISTPQPRLTNSRPDRMILTLGDTKERPDSSLTMYVDVKKAVVPATAETMKKMSMRGFEKARTQAAMSQSQSQSQAPRGLKRSAPEERDVEGGDEDEGKKEALQRQIRFAEKQKREHQAQALAGEDVDMGNVGADFDKLLHDAGLREGDGEDADLNSHAVTQEKRFFYRPPEKPKGAAEDAKAAAAKKGRQDEDDDEEEALDEEEPGLREAVNADLTDAYHYGGTLVPLGDLEDGAGTLAGLQTGMEIVSFMKDSDVHPEWRMGDVFYVYATPGQLGSEKIFSAFVNGMFEKKSVAVVRFVKKGSTRNGKPTMPDPQLGILYPSILEVDGTVEFCYWCRLPYAEDLRVLTFPSLDRLFNRKGVRLEQHKDIPTAEMQTAMDALVDSMDLTVAGSPDEDGKPTDWFTTDDSYSPAIHNISNTLVFRMTNPDGDLPPVPRILTKYMDPPASIVENSNATREKVISLFDVKLVPPKPKALNKTTAHYSTGDQAPIDIADIVGSGVVASSAPVARLPSPAMDVHGASSPRDATTASPVTKLEKMEEEDDFVVVDKADAMVVDEEEEEAEPDTEDDEPDTEDEDDAPMRSAPSVQSPVTLVKEAETAVLTSFSRQLYSKAVGLLQEAARSAMQSKTSSTYNDALRAFTDRIRAQRKKRDFLEVMQTSGVSLVGVSTEESQGFSKELA